MVEELLGICQQIQQIKETESSILFWGEDNYDAELMAFYYHEYVLNLSENTRFTLYCYENVDIVNELESYLISIPPVPKVYDGMPVSIILHEINNLSPLQQARLLKIMINKLNSRLNHCRFILLVKDASALIDEFKPYFNNHTFHVMSLSLRKKDIMPLAEFILKRFFDEEPPTFSLDAEGYLMSYDWTHGSMDMVEVIERAVSRFKQDDEEVLSKRHFGVDQFAELELDKIYDGIAS